MSGKPLNLVKVGTYHSMSLPFELTDEQLRKLPPGKELHFDRARKGGAHFAPLVKQLGCEQ